MPFDAARRGFVMGEGGFMLVLEDEESASARGARVLAEVLGTASSSSSVAINAWPDDDVALVRAMRLAIEDAGITPDDVDVVYAAANGTVPLDRQEAAGIREVFGGRDVRGDVDQGRDRRVRRGRRRFGRRGDPLRASGRDRPGDRFPDAGRGLSRQRRLRSRARAARRGRADRPRQQLRQRRHQLLGRPSPDSRLISD